MSIPNSLSGDWRISKNAVMLCVYMFLTMIVGLYISRAVLAVLGVEDCGNYGVGGIVAMIGFMNRAEMAVGAA